MALENITAGSTIDDLDTASPGGSEDLSQGDDHIVNIKKAVKYTFMNLSATVSAVASELDFAHKGGTVSGNAQIKGTLTVSSSAVVLGDVHVGGTLSVSGNAIVKGDLSASGANFAGALSVGGNAVFSGGLGVSATISGSIEEAAFARSASYAYSAVHALSASAWDGAAKHTGTATPSATLGSNGDLFFLYE